VCERGVGKRAGGVKAGELREMRDGGLATRYGREFGRRALRGGLISGALGRELAGRLVARRGDGPGLLSVSGLELDEPCPLGVLDQGAELRVVVNRGEREPEPVSG
jgi:hypothetical protein